MEYTKLQGMKNYKNFGRCLSQGHIRAAVPDYLVDIGPAISVLLINYVLVGKDLIDF